jgi:hypothetical protein
MFRIGSTNTLLSSDKESLWKGIESLRALLLISRTQTNREKEKRENTTNN